ncbi:MAG: histidine phosphatase family protein [Methylobacterium mesophilicum]|nr:histidine phosphatase family protein [Methylobacterium mesophilicum]
MIRYLAFVFIALVATQPVQATEAGWALLREGGHAVLLRHARTGGTSDPANVDPENCATQRGLNDQGKQQARRIGALLAARAARTDEVLSSRFCRASETADLAFEAEPQPFTALDPLPAGHTPEQATEQMRAIIDRIEAFQGSGNLVMVSHLEVINALTGQSPREGEALIVKPDGQTLQVLGRVVFN